MAKAGYNFLLRNGGLFSRRCDSCCGTYHTFTARRAHRAVDALRCHFRGMVWRFRLGDAGDRTRASGFPLLPGAPNQFIYLEVQPIRCWYF